MASEVCFISPYAELTTAIKEALSILPEPPHIIEGAIEAAEPLAYAAQEQGTEVFVTTEGNARHLRTKLAVPVVAIPVGPFDTVCALQRAKAQYGQPVALFEFRHPNPHLATLKEITQCDIHEYVYRDQEDGLAKLRQAKAEGCRAVVSGGLVATLAQSLGCQCVPIYPGVEAILQAYRQAREIARVRQTERREAAKFKSIVQYSFEGIIVVDQDNKITVFNPAAERILGIPAEQAVGRPIREVIPQSQLPLVTETGQRKLDQLRTF
ncbi:MAG: PrpR N-terminal domain-containing protein, partial [Clostridia bacterium]|nr:PrpR N-terminal domain-containing protein [Clostridia bacterium]